MTMIDKGTADQAIEWATDRLLDGTRAQEFLRGWREGEITIPYARWLATTPPSSPTDTARVDWLEKHSRDNTPALVSDLLFLVYAGHDDLRALIDAEMEKGR